MTFEPSRWENSLIATKHVCGDSAATAARIDLSNFYQWEIRLSTSVNVAGIPMKVSFFFEDPLQNPSTPSFDLGITDPTMFDYQAGSVLLSSNGTSWPTGQATIWVICDVAAPNVSLTVWGSRRV
jgi:hypothetical protein